MVSFNSIFFSTNVICGVISIQAVYAIPNTKTAKTTYRIYLLFCERIYNPFPNFTHNLVLIIIINTLSLLVKSNNILVKETMIKCDKIILLVGLIGSGKTSVGKRLAKKLSLPFVDGDQEIEKASGLSVIDVYKCFGVDEYRAGEARIMKRLLNGNVCVLASGGGAFVAKQTREIAKQKAITIWLKADIEVLYNRTKERKRRPFLQCSDSKIKSKLQSYIDEESPFYSEADIIVETRNENVEYTVNRVLEALESYFSKNTLENC